MKRRYLYEFLKRTFDFLFAIIGLLLSALIWVVAIIGIEISDPGPIFYKAKRVGKNNKEFKMFKFRSMKISKNANEASFKADENRIFKFGAFMRRTKIDELPQLLNILLGHMSIVGPRPASVDQVDIVRAGEFAIVSTVVAGLTSPSSLYDYIYGDSITDEVEYKEKVLPTRLLLDAYYVHFRGIFFDLKMIVYTAICVFLSIFNHTPRRIYNKLISYAEKMKKREGAQNHAG